MKTMGSISGDAHRSSPPSPAIPAMSETSGLRPLLQRYLHLLPMILIMSDQAVISGTRLLSQVAVGRWGGPDQLGLYSIAMGVVMVMVGMQEALVTTPYTVYSPRQSNENRRRFSVGALWVQMLLMIGMTLFWAATVWVRGLQGGFTGGVLWVMTAVIWFGPFQLVREFSRRWLLAGGMLRGTLALDIASSALLALLLGLVVWKGSVDARIVFGMGAIANLFYIAVWATRYRRDFPLLNSSPRVFAGLSWSYGRWIAGESIFSILMVYYIGWHLTYFQDESRAGIFQSCMTVVLLANPFLLGFASFLGPRAAQTYHREGWPALWSLTWKSLVFVVLVLGVLAAVLFVGGDWFVTRVFGQKYAGNGDLIAMLGIGMVGLGISYVVTCALQTAGWPQVNFAGSVASGVFLVVWCLMLVRTDLHPAATGFTLAVFFGVLIRCAGLLASRFPVGGSRQRQ